jgi:putative ABC transport system permease protein
VENTNRLSLILKLAWRDSRRQRGRLLLFISSIIVGIAALVAIRSFSENLQSDINAQARELLGADVSVNGITPPTPSVKKVLDSLRALPESDEAQNVSFLSMALLPQKKATRQVNVQAIRGIYPFYGKIESEPANAALTFQSERKALIDNTLRIQFDLKIGDSIKIGDNTYAIAGHILSAPGRSGIGGAIAPVVFLPLAALDSANLLQRGSRVNYSYLFKLSEKINGSELAKKIKPTLEPEKYSVESVADRKRNAGNSFGQMADFLNLVGFIALLLGCIGVASAVNIYVKDKLPTVAILRTLGASGKQAFWVYLVQIATMGLGGAIIGAALGSVIQTALPVVLKDFLPVENVTNTPSVSAMLMGVVTGLGIAVLFALLPLLSIRHISPLRVLRSGFEETENQRDWLRYVVIGLIAVFIFGFTYLQTKSVQSSVIFIAGIGIAIGLLALVAWLLIRILRAKILRGVNFSFRQSIANLHRPNNQTLTLIVSIGLGTMLISTLLLIQQLLLNQISFVSSGNQPNFIIFDIKTRQKDSIQNMVASLGMPLIQRVPVVTMRPDNINGLTYSEHRKDSLRKDERPRWIFGEYRATYRDTLIDSEQLLEGKLPPKGRMPDGTVGITLSDNAADDLKIPVGGYIIFNVQGMPIKCTVTGIRKVDFARVQTNFRVLFPSGVLEGAPQFHVVVSRVNSAEQSAKAQQDLVSSFPDISVIDSTQILKVVSDILRKISFVIRFMALFSILTGLVVLISSVYLSKFQRIRESVLLRTIGANRAKILTINALEYLWLGGLATMTGVLLSVGAAWGLSRFSFRIPFHIDWLSLLLTPLSITALVVIIGLLNSRQVVNESPLEVLRQEV